MTTVNDRQVAGSHYKVEGMQHWDLISKWDIPYLAGCATKYICRAGRKGAPETDLMKAIHYVEKMIEAGKSVNVADHNEIHEDISALARSMRLSAIQTSTLNYIILHKSRDELSKAIALINRMMLNGPGTPEDGGHHG